MFSLRSDWTAATFSFSAQALLEIFDPPQARGLVLSAGFTLLSCNRRKKSAPAIPSHKGQLTRRSQSTSSGCYCNTARDDGATKIGFHIQAEQLLTAATTCACLIVTSTEREMVTSMLWLAHLSSIIGFASYSCVFGGSLSLWLGFLSIRRKSPQKLHK